MADSEQPLPGGLVLRTVRSADLEQVGELLAERGEPVDADDFRLMVGDPDYGLDACAVVADGDRVVSTLLLLDEELTLGRPGVALPAGQVDLVATDTEYEGRGLVRALMGWAHQRSAARGHVVQVMLGIPYFYRRFGYSYAIDIAQSYTVSEPPPSEPGYTFRAAENADIPALRQCRTGSRTGWTCACPTPGPAGGGWWPPRAARRGSSSTPGGRSRPAARPHPRTVSS